MSTLEREREQEARLDKAYESIGKLLVEGDRLRAIITMVRQDLQMRRRSELGKDEGPCDRESSYAENLFNALSREIEKHGVTLERRT